MRSILIYGDTDAGKTTICRKLLKILMVMDASLVSYQAYRWNDWSDFYSLLHMGHKRIAIYSAGDEKSHLAKALEFGETSKADILIGVLSNHKHYNEPLAPYKRNIDYFWYELHYAESIEEKSSYQTRLLKDILSKIIDLLDA